MDEIKKIILDAALGAMLFFAGFFVHDIYFAEPSKVQWRTETKTNTVYRDYVNTPPGIKDDALLCYDTGNFKIDFIRISDDAINITTKLCERTAQRELTIGRPTLKNIIGGGVILDYSAIAHTFVFKYSASYYRHVYAGFYAGGQVLFGRDGGGVMIGGQYLF